VSLLQKASEDKGGRDKVTGLSVLYFVVSIF